MTLLSLLLPGRLHPELPQVMVQVLVHQHRPLVRRQGPEERVRVRRAAGGAGGADAIDHREQSRALDAAIDHTLRYLPWPISGIVKKVLLG